MCISEQAIPRHSMSPNILNNKKGSVIMSRNFFDALAYEIDSKKEFEIFDCKQLNGSPSYKIITITNIAEQLFEKPEESIIFSLSYELDEGGIVIVNENHGFFSISLKPNYGIGKYLLFVSCGGLQIGVDFDNEVEMPSLNQIHEVVLHVLNAIEHENSTVCQKIVS